MNPRSIYNCVDQFTTFVEQKQIDLIFLSESWERENLPLDKIIKMENFKVLSNVFQRKEKGGRPALIISEKNIMSKT